MDYITVKWLHILSSTILFGTGIGSAFYLLFACLSRDVRTIAHVAKHVVIADWIFTATTVVFQPLTGFYLLHLSGITPKTNWVFWSIVLYIVAIACWLPVVWLQIQMRDIAQRAILDVSALPDSYWKYFKFWMALGFPAFFAFLAIFYLMVVKPWSVYSIL